MIGATFGAEPPLGKPLKSIAPSSCEKKKGPISFSKNYTSFSSDTILDCCPKKTRKKIQYGWLSGILPRWGLDPIRNSTMLIYQVMIHLKIVGISPADL